MSQSVTVRAVLAAVGAHYRLRPEDLRGPRRHKPLARARAVAMYLGRTLVGSSYPKLAREFGGKHHTTVIHAVQQTGRRLLVDESLRSDIAAIEQRIACAAPEPVVPAAHEVLVGDDDSEAFCPGCDDWVAIADAEVCAACGESTCADHRKPRQHDCREMRELRALDQEVPA